MGYARAEEFRDRLKLEYLNAALQRAKRMPALKTLLRKQPTKGPSLAEIIKVLDTKSTEEQAEKPPESTEKPAPKKRAPRKKKG